MLILLINVGGCSNYYPKATIGNQFAATNNHPQNGGIGDILVKSIGRTLSNFGTARLRSSYHPVLREMGGMMRTVDEQEEDGDSVRKRIEKATQQEAMEARRREMDDISRAAREEQILDILRRREARELRNYYSYR